MNQRVVTFHYTLTNHTGAVIDSSREQQTPMSFLEGTGQILPALEAQLLAMQPNEQRRIDIVAADAYGTHSDQLVFTADIAQIPEGAQPGDLLQLENEHEVRPAVVLELTDTHATIDANHPLAGMDLTFDVELVELRTASAEEIAHGHVHGPDGHH